MVGFQIYNVTLSLILSYFTVSGNLPILQYVCELSFTIQKELNMIDKENIIRKAQNTITEQQDEIEYLNKMIHTLKDVKDGEREKARQYLQLTMEQSPIYQRVIDDMVDNDFTPSDITLKRLTLGVSKKPRYDDFIKDATGITRDEIEPRSASLRRKDKEYQHFTRRHKEYFVE